MPTLVDLAHGLYQAVRLAALAFIFGLRLFYVVGPLVAGATLGCFSLYACVRYVAWPVARDVFRLTVRGVRWLLATPAPVPAAAGARFTHPVA